MKFSIYKVFTILIFLVLIIGCSEEEIYPLDEFYDSFKINSVQLSVDRNVFFEGDDPVVFSAIAEDIEENDLELFDYVLVVDGKDTLPGKTFLPAQSGQYTVKAIANQLESNELRVWYVLDEDIQELNLSYETYNHLTTEPWSVTGDFILYTTINGFPVDISKSSVPLFDENGKQFRLDQSLHFDEPGEYTLQARFNNRTSEKLTFYVRESQSFDVVTLPIVYHFINMAPNTSEIERAIASYNRIFNNENITLNDNPIVNQWENPSWVNAFIRFELAKENPQGEAFEGFTTINTGNERINSKEDLIQLVNANNWDPNKYLNIYVSSDPYNISIGASPVLEDTMISGLSTLGGDGFVNGDFPPMIYNHREIYNSNTLGNTLGLFSNFGCGEDYCDDTFSYDFKRQPFLNIDPIRGDGGSTDTWSASSCNSEDNQGEFYVKNIMDDAGVDREFRDDVTGELEIERAREVITHDQRARMRGVINHAINLPTPKNR